MNYTPLALALTAVALVALIGAWLSGEHPPQQSLPGYWGPQAVFEPAQAVSEPECVVRLVVEDAEERRAMAMHIAENRALLTVDYVIYNGMVNLGDGWVAVENHQDWKTVLVSFARCEE